MPRTSDGGQRPRFPGGSSVSSSAAKQRRRAEALEAALRASETRFRALIEHGTDLTSIVGPDGRISYASPSHTRLLGYAPLELIGKPAFDYVHPVDLARTQAAFARAQAGDTAENREEYRFRHKDGSWRAFEANVTNLVQEPTVAGLVINSRDITKRRAAEEALAQERFLMQTLMNSSPDFIYFKDRDSRFIRISKALAQLFGLSDPAQAVGKTDADFFTQEHARQAYEDEQAIIRTGLPLTTEERETWADRPDTWVSTTKMPLGGAGGNAVGTFGISRDITERKQAEEALALQTAILKASETRFRALGGMAPVGIFCTDPQGRGTYLNDQLLQIIGLTAEEAAGDGFLRSIHPDDRQRVMAELAQVAVTGQPWRSEHRCLRPDGTVTWVLVQSVIERDYAGRVIGSIGTITDVTDLRLRTEALRESEARLQSLFAGIDDALFVCDLEGKIIDCNEAACRRLGHSREELLGMHSSEVDAPEFAAGFRERSEQQLRLGRLTWEGVHMTKDGRRIPVNTHSTVIDYHGTKAVLALVRDISESKRAEEALALKTTVLETQQQTSLDGILVEDGHGKMISFNQPFVALWGIPPEIAASGSTERALQFVFDKIADPDAFMARVAHLHEHREEKSREEIALKDGRTLDRYSAPMFGADGRYYGRVWYFRDITALRRAQLSQERALSEAEQASRTKSGFIANMSHELRTPLNSVIGFASLLAQNAAGNLTAQDVDFLGRIEDNGKHLLALINSILDLSKIEAGKVALAIADVPLGQLIRETLSLTGCVRREGGLFVGEVEVRAEVPPGLRPIRADPGKLKQVLINLVGNALKFTERGSVTVRVVADPATGEAERIDVADTGIGIPKERQAAVFEAFEQADATTARRYHGTGLGLTISRTLLQQMGYRVSVASEVGKGTTFSVHLRGAGTRYGALEPAPVANAGPAPESVSVTTAAAAPPLTGSPDKTEFRGYTVLVIDDDADARLLLDHMIAGHGATVLTASSGAEALDLARTAHPDLVTVDVMMPQMSGWEVIQALREDPALRAIPALIVSVVADAPESALVGAEDRLSKPVNREALLAALRRHLPRGGKAK